jgi:hypothetical protein
MRPRGPGESALLLLDAVEVLDSQGTRYAVVGALAASVHGAVRGSADADVLIGASVQEATRIGEAFRRAGFKSVLSRGDPQDDIPAVIGLTDTFGNRVDVLVGLRGLESHVFSRTVEVPFHGSTLVFIGREDFIAMKVFAGGPIDLQDAERAVAANPSSLDVQLVRRLAAGFGREASAALESILSAERSVAHNPTDDL